MDLSPDTDPSLFLDAFCLVDDLISKLQIQSMKEKKVEQVMHNYKKIYYTPSHFLILRRKIYILEQQNALKNRNEANKYI